MKTKFLTSALCFLLLLNSPNLATAQGYIPIEHHHHHHRDWGGRAAAFVAGEVVGAAIANAQRPQYIVQPQPQYIVVMPQQITPQQFPPNTYPNPYQPVTPVPPPVVYQSPPPDNGYWHYCQSAARYYPYVKNCYEGWVEVVPR